MIFNPLSNMQIRVFVWGGWGRMEAARARGVEGEGNKEEFGVIGKATILCCGPNEVHAHTQTDTHISHNISDINCTGWLGISMLS